MIFDPLVFDRIVFDAGAIIVPEPGRRFVIRGGGQADRPDRSYTLRSSRGSRVSSSRSYTSNRGR